MFSFCFKIIVVDIFYYRLTRLPPNKPSSKPMNKPISTFLRKRPMIRPRIMHTINPIFLLLFITREIKSIKKLFNTSTPITQLTDYPINQSTNSSATQLNSPSACKRRQRLRAAHGRIPILYKQNFLCHILR